jgi:phosphoribosyl 1,2-cyclic phosphodiesterase/ActR/RegA family two-component response regulator
VDTGDQNPSLSIFLVDEDQTTLDLMSSILSEAGHTVSAYQDSEKALSDINNLKPDCVATNLVMPGLDGLALCKEIRSNSELSHTKILIISSKSYDLDRKRAFEFGADGYITKPLNSDTFLDQINRIVEDKIDLHFWGVRGTLPVPGDGTLRYGGNTSCVTMEFPRGQFFIFDGGSGIKSLSDWLMAQNRRRIQVQIFISHPHWDHINALPFFVPLYIQGNSFEFYGASHGDLTTESLISAQMDGVYFPITIHEFGANIGFTDLQEEEVEVADIPIKTMLLSHPGYCLGYRIDYHGRSICYVTDNELFPIDNEFHDPAYLKKLINFIQGADVLITDSTYTDKEYETKVGWGHSRISEVTDLAHQAEVKNLYLFHHDPDQTDDDIVAKHEAAQKLLADVNSKTICHAPAANSRIQI